jgi:hypothetical protein
MGKKIYGIDISKKITPMMVRDAIIRCFHEAHHQILHEMKNNNEFKSVSEQESFERIQIENIIISAFDDVKADFNNPTKEDIKRVMNELAKFSSKFRKPEIIKKHYNEIMQLVEKLD